MPEKMVFILVRREHFNEKVKEEIKRMREKKGPLKRRKKTRQVERTDNECWARMINGKEMIRNSTLDEDMGAGAL